MRKIASNYLLTQEFRVLKRGYCLLDIDGEVCSLGVLREDVPEEHGVEFYAGMIIPGQVDIKGAFIGENIADFIARIGHFNSKSYRGVTLITALDWDFMSLQETTTVSYIT